MTPSKEKEIEDRFHPIWKSFIDDFFQSKPHCINDFYHKNKAFYLSELSRVEKETENRVWREASEKVNSRKKVGQVCSCGGNLIPSHGLGKISFPYQCEKCGSYTDDNNELNQTLSDISSTLLSQVKE